MGKSRLLFCLLVVASIMALSLPLFDMVYLYPSATSLINEKIRHDAESLGQFLATELLNHEQQPEHLVAIKQRFNFARVNLRSADGRVLFSTDPAQVKPLPVVSTGLRQGVSRSRFLLNRNNPTDRGRLIEVQVPLLIAGELHSILEIIHDAAPLQLQFERSVTRASIFLLLAVAVFWAVILSISRLAHKAISRQQQTDEQLTESQRQLQLKHQELNQLFSLVEQAKYEWQLTLDCISDIIMLVEESGKVRRCNEALIRFVGRSYLEVLGKDWKRILFSQGGEMISLNRQHSEIYHPGKGVWLYIEYYPYQNEKGEMLTVIRLQQQAQQSISDVQQISQAT